MGASRRLGPFWLLIAIFPALTACGDGGTEPDPIAPKAAFTVECDELACSVDGSGSSDSDGTIASHAWDFGDGATRTGAQASHVYSEAGGYTITLRVTDNDGLTNETSREVQVVGPFRVSWAVDVSAIYSRGDTINCEYAIAVSASGGARGASARWRPSSGEWVDPASNERYSFSLTTTDMLDYFGADRITTGGTLQANRIAWWDRPFHLLHVFRYEMPDGSLRSEDVWVDCAE